MSSLPDYYRLLGVPRNASFRTIRKAYRDAALRNHPDNCPEDGRAEAERKFKLIGQAYRTLRSAEGRRRYDFRWQQYTATVGVDRFRRSEQTDDTDRAELFWSDEGQGPGFYRRVSRNRDEVGILVLACLAAVVVSGAAVPVLAGWFASTSGRQTPEGGDIFSAFLLAQGLYLAVLASTVSILLLTRQSLRKLAELRNFSRMLTACGHVLPTDRKDKAPVSSPGCDGSRPQ